MTALEQYERLECTGLWRETPDAQRQEVVVALGEASLVITDKAGRPLTHWSLPAVERLNPGQMPARYQPGGDAEEQLELDDSLMIEGIETVRTAIERRRAHPGRLRAMIFLVFFAALIGLSVFWLPGAMMRTTAAAVPAAKRLEIGQDVLAHIHRVAGGECTTPRANLALATLAERLNLGEGARIAVLASGARQTAHLPGRLILVNRALAEDFDTPDVLSGFVVAEAERAAAHDPLLDLLEQAGLGATFRLMTTGNLSTEAMNAFGERLLTGQPEPLGDEALLAAFARARIAASPYAYAIDLTGEETFNLIEADPYGGGGAPALLTDADWVSVQGVCGE